MNYKIITLIELGMIVVSMFIGHTYTALLFTILLFDLFEGNLTLYIEIICCGVLALIFYVAGVMQSKGKI